MTAIGVRAAGPELHLRLDGMDSSCDLVGIDVPKSPR